MIRFVTILSIRTDNDSFDFCLSSKLLIDLMIYHQIRFVAKHAEICFLLSILFFRIIRSFVSYY